ncbi:MAG: hypothetical protein K1X92_10185 [Bacteroidia bacterium]|nr:hypothetical protein [Bacteroidia bacterium]
MSIVADYKNELNLVLTVNVGPESYKPIVDKELKKYAKVANIPGFRKGSAPMGLIKKMAGKSLVLEAITDAVSDELTNYIRENNLNVLGNPMAINPISEDSVDMDCKNEISIDFEIGLSPDFELNVTPSEPLMHYHVEADDEFLNKEIESLKDRYGLSTECEEVTEGDWIFGSLREVNEAGEFVEEGAQKVISLNPSRIEKPELFQPFYGVKKDESVDFDIFTVDEDEKELERIFFFKDNELDKLRGKKTKLLIKRITRVVPAEMNAEFFKKVLGEHSAVETEEDFREELRNQYNQLLANDEKGRFTAKVRETLIAINNISLPDEFLKKWMLNDKNNKDLTPENIDEVYNENRPHFQWEIIRGKVESLYPDVIPTKEDLDESIRNAIRSFLATQDVGQNEDTIFKNLTQDKEFVEKQYKGMLESNYQNLFESLVPHQHGHIQATDYVKMLAEQQQ